MIIVIYSKTFKVKTLLVSALIAFTFLFSGMFLHVSAVECNGATVGYVRSVNSEKHVSRNIMKEIENKVVDDTDIECNIRVFESYIIPANQMTEPDKIADDILDNDKNLISGYSLKLFGKTFCAYETMAEVNRYIDKIASVFSKYKKVSNISVLKFGIEKSYFSSPFEVKISEFLDYAGYNLNLSDYRDFTEMNKRETYSLYSPYVSEDTIISEGCDEIKKVQYYCNIHNEKIIGKELISETVLQESVPQLIYTSDKNKVSRENAVEALFCLDNGMSEKQKEFVAKILPTVIDGYNNYDILPSLTLAQAILESDWGTCHIKNNLFGFKSYSINEPRTACLTHEFVNGEYIETTCYFRTYNSFEDSVKDYHNLLYNNQIYSKVISADNYVDACKEQGKSGYATCPTYGEQLLNLIETYNLYYWD